MSPNLTLPLSWNLRASVTLPVLFGCALLALGLLPSPATGNLAPPPVVRFNILPWDGTWVYCETEATDCEEIVPTRPDLGTFLVEVLLDRNGVWDPITRLSLDLFWPDTWYLTDYVFCNEITGELDYWQGPIHHLDAELPCELPGSMILVAALLFDVTGYGVLWPSGDCRYWIGCPPDYENYADALFAEAGTRCARTVDPCATWAALCAPYFPVEEARLSGQTGQSAHVDLDFTVGNEEQWTSCWPILHAEEEWIRPSVVMGEHPWQYVLSVGADLTGLEPGTYTSEIHVAGDWHMERCIPAIVEVGAPSGVATPGGDSRSGAPSTLRLAGRNPSAGPFELRYDLPERAVVRCGVYDPAGREIASLLAGEEQPAGSHEVAWDACDSRGDRVGPGVYMIRLVVGGESRAARVIVVR